MCRHDIGLKSALLQVNLIVEHANLDCSIYIVNYYKE